jgi:hypothetical protein
MEIGPDADTAARASFYTQQSYDFIAICNIILKLLNIRLQYFAAVPPVVRGIELILYVSPPFYSIAGHFGAGQLDHPYPAVYKKLRYFRHCPPVPGAALNL